MCIVWGDLMNFLIEHLSKKYGNKIVLKDIDFTIVESRGATDCR